jgi:hypothetical protein
VTKTTLYSDFLEASIKGFDDRYPENNIVNPCLQAALCRRIAHQTNFFIEL